MEAVQLIVASAQKPFNEDLEAWQARIYKDLDEYFIESNGLLSLFAVKNYIFFENYQSQEAIIFGLISKKEAVKLIYDRAPIPIYDLRHKPINETPRSWRNKINKRLTDDKDTPILNGLVGINAVFNHVCSTRHTYSYAYAKGKFIQDGYEPVRRIETSISCSWDRGNPLVGAGGGVQETETTKLNRKILEQSFEIEALKRQVEEFRIDAEKYRAWHDKK